MKIKILDLAESDLIDGFYFYEAKETGLGDFFPQSSHRLGEVRVTP